MPRFLNVYRELWCNNEGFECKYFIRKLHGQLQTLTEIVQAKTMIREMFGEQNAQRYLQFVVLYTSYTSFPLSIFLCYQL